MRFPYADDGWDAWRRIANGFDKPKPRVPQNVRAMKLEGITDEEWAPLFMVPYYETMPKFQTAADVMAYLASRGESLERHEHLPVQDAWDDDKWVCEVPDCHWASSP